MDYDVNIQIAIKMNVEKLTNAIIGDIIKVLAFVLTTCKRTSVHVLVVVLWTMNIPNTAINAVSVLAMIAVVLVESWCQLMETVYTVICVPTAFNLKGI